MFVYILYDWKKENDLLNKQSKLNTESNLNDKKDKRYKYFIKKNKDRIFLLSFYIILKINPLISLLKKKKN